MHFSSPSFTNLRFWFPKFKNRIYGSLSLATNKDKDSDILSLGKKLNIHKIPSLTAFTKQNATAIPP